MLNDAKYIGARPASPKLIGCFGEAGLGTGVLLLPSHRGSAQADAADGSS
jgi:hypothetical protein